MRKVKQDNGLLPTIYENEPYMVIVSQTALQVEVHKHSASLMQARMVKGLWKSKTFGRGNSVKTDVLEQLNLVLQQDDISERDKALVNGLIRALNK